MAVFGAGERTVFDKVKPVLEASFSNVMYTGGIGTAMIPKAMFLPLAKAVRSTSDKAEEDFIMAIMGDGIDKNSTSISKRREP